MIAAHFSRSLSLVAAATAAAGFGLALGAPAGAAPVAAAVATSSPSGGVVYTGTSAATVTRLRLSGTQFVIDDDGPITAGAGCSAVAGDPTQVVCAAPTDTTGALRRPKLSALSGNDTIINDSSVGMIADGGIGFDVLRGGVASTSRDDLTGGPDGDTLTGGGGSDRLSGGAGVDALDGGPLNDTLIGGGAGDKIVGGDGDDVFLAAGANDGTDTVDLGAGLHDRVDYTNRTLPVFIDLAGSASSGESGENDTLLNVEDADGSLFVSNTILGNDSANKLLGGTANDAIFGLRGADRIGGGGGDDALSSNGLFDVISDGVKDTLIGGPNTDTCAIAPADGDVAFECESV